jgi:AcrR family transcriptional regulator
MTPRERVLKTASRLFYAEGIRAVGVERIAAEAKVSKMTLYHHFPSKDELVAAVLDGRDQPTLNMIAAAADQGADPRARLLMPFEMLDALFKSRGYRGCPFMNASLELAEPGHPASKVASRHKESTRDQLELRAREAGASAPAALADQLAVLLDGAMAQAQMRDRATVAGAALAAATTLVDRALA